MERTQGSITIAVIVLVLFHQVGLIGLHLPASRDLFIQLVPFNLLLSAGLLAWFHQRWSVNFGILIFVIFWAGYLIELAGVKTGIIFGEYAYDRALGPKIADVPPMIGLNWVLLTYSTGVIARMAFQRLWVRIVAAALMMVFLDILIEPMAMRFEFWSWAGNVVPLQNFVAWFIVSLLMQLGFQTQEQEVKNSLAYPFYLVQVGFFAVFWLVDAAF